MKSSGIDCTVCLNNHSFAVTGMGALEVKLTRSVHGGCNSETDPGAALLDPCVWCFRETRNSGLLVGGGKLFNFLSE